MHSITSFDITQDKWGERNYLLNEDQRRKKINGFKRQTAGQMKEFKRAAESGKIDGNNLIERIDNCKQNIREINNFIKAYNSLEPLKKPIRFFSEDFKTWKTNQITDLHEDICKIIVSYTCFNSLATCRLISKSFSNAIQNNPLLSFRAKLVSFEQLLNKKDTQNTIYSIERKVNSKNAYDANLTISDPSKKSYKHFHQLIIKFNNLKNEKKFNFTNNELSRLAFEVFDIVDNNADILIQTAVKVRLFAKMGKTLKDPEMQEVIQLAKGSLISFSNIDAKQILTCPVENSVDVFSNIAARIIDEQLSESITSLGGF